MNTLKIVLADITSMHDGWGGGWMMVFGMTLFWGLIIFGIIWLVRSSLSDHLGATRKTALEVLDERLARGDISVEEYKQRRAALFDQD